MDYHNFCHITSEDENLNISRYQNLNSVLIEIRDRVHASNDQLSFTVSFRQGRTFFLTKISYHQGKFQHSMNVWLNNKYGSYLP